MKRKPLKILLLVLLISAITFLCGLFGCFNYNICDETDEQVEARMKAGKMRRGERWAVIARFDLPEGKKLTQYDIMLSYFDKSNGKRKEGEFWQRRASPRAYP